jgi:uncharacterized membrane protein (UPF0127 family)
VLVTAPRALLTLQVAADEETRERGLMFRPRLAPQHGMLFVFSREGERHFWMKNTYVALDMAFVASNGRVLSIAAGVPAAAAGTSEEQIPRRSGYGRFVVELPADEAAADGIAPGTVLRLFSTPHDFRRLRSR